MDKIQFGESEFSTDLTLSDIYIIVNRTLDALRSRYRIDKIKTIATLGGRIIYEVQTKTRGD